MHIYIYIYIFFFWASQNAFEHPEMHGELPLVSGTNPLSVAKTSFFTANETPIDRDAHLNKAKT